MDKRRWIFLKDGNRLPQKSDSTERESLPESGSESKDRCLCHQGKKCAFCLMRDGEL